MSLSEISSVGRSRRDAVRTASLFFTTGAPRNLAAVVACVRWLRWLQRPLVPERVACDLTSVIRRRRADREGRRIHRLPERIPQQQHPVRPARPGHQPMTGEIRERPRHRARLIRPRHPTRQPHTAGHGSADLLAPRRIPRPREQIPRHHRRSRPRRIHRPRHDAPRRIPRDRHGRTIRVGRPDMTVRRVIGELHVTQTRRVAPRVIDDLRSRNTIRHTRRTRDRPRHRRRAQPI